MYSKVLIFLALITFGLVGCNQGTTSANTDQKKEAQASGSSDASTPAQTESTPAPDNK